MPIFDVCVSRDLSAMSCTIFPNNRKMFVGGTSIQGKFSRAQAKCTKSPSVKQ